MTVVYHAINSLLKRKGRPDVTPPPPVVNNAGFGLAAFGTTPFGGTP